ncbi:hypothetical protein [Burkholderia orbicola]|jgi:NAD/NADP transhydrogenase beta subunit|uniref:Uncharacterized protein n=1 Tax=Burkholderia orbicola TaxID=2978683 RepID=A0ABT8P1H4_9BURK|nr:hypothetical protein [Burkholderia orbicola]MDN7527688.1 hypothetical protein [Burkholderia orbicola]
MLTVDLKMSWASLLPVLLAGYADGTAEGRSMAVEQLKKTAAAADFAHQLAEALEMVLTVFERSTPTAGHWMEVQHARELLRRLPVREISPAD